MLRKRIRGFTAFELLLIVTVFSVVAVALAPIVETAKERNRSTVCLNNLKQCAMALRLYWNDWNDCLPSSALATNPPGGNPTTTQVMNFLTAKGNPWPAMYGHPTTTWPRALRAYVDGSCVFCPSDYPRSRVSYWYKYAADRACRDSSIGAPIESRFAYHADQIIFYEHSGWHMGDAAGIRNGVQINVAYMDGHVSTITVKNGPTDYPAKGDERTGAAAIRLGEPMYYNYNFDTNTYHPGVAGYIDPRNCGDK